MLLDSIFIENFRPFKELRIRFNSKLNVIIGLNGAGKTAILDSIAIALNPFINKLTTANSTIGSFLLQKTDIYAGAEKTDIELTINQGIAASYKWHVGRTFNTRNVWSINYLIAYATAIKQQLAQNPLSNMPIIAYYSTARMNFDNTAKVTSRKSNYEYNQLFAYQNSLFRGVNSFNDFIMWFADEEGYEDKVRLDIDNSYRNPKLQVVRNAIETFLNGFESMSSSFKNMRIKKERNDNNAMYRSHIISTLVIKKDGVDFQMGQLSSGEKMMIMLVVDIARRLSIANPSLDNPLLGEGIVLIDEIDLHLHPQWQREIVPALTNTFPNCQFVVTTHSPQVLSRVKKEHIIIIEGDKIASNPPHTYGKDTNSILYEIFNTLERPRDIQEKLDKCYKFIELEEFDAANAILADLVNVLDEYDSDIVKIKSLLTLNGQ